eukprot:CAMPEP_0170452960 /NCGR_PEP_ID=MMETSP0123-20130129/1696_1 /TAXON_ID=182087 /ORGANISM="Favella ehrenbergii, Strain Fehren 1" /LENGTH=120 /DNA_ID=CAMNT_0010715163 /DNA_START=2990 /DNA_END=3352 /DNA_ORIENTATION=+
MSRGSMLRQQMTATNKSEYLAGVEAGYGNSKASLKGARLIGNRQSSKVTRDPETETGASTTKMQFREAFNNSQFSFNPELDTGKIVKERDAAAVSQKKADKVGKKESRRNRHMVIGTSSE